MAGKKGMEIMLSLKAKIDKALPKNMEELTQRTEKLKKVYSQATPKGFSEKLSQELSKANKDLKLAQHNLSKASSIKPKYKEIRESYSANLIQLRKYRAEIKRLEKAKAAGVKLSDKKERSLKKLISQNKNFQILWQSKEQVFNGTEWKPKTFWDS